jgi:SAM-dependent methyltransferase
VSSPYSATADSYNDQYAWKDYAGEAARLHLLIGREKTSAGNRLLDVACGTGSHLAHLRQHYACAGLDLDAKMLDVARSLYPDVAFHEGDMLDFELGETFDVVTCLFFSIAHARTPDNLTRAVATMARHIAPGGVLLIQPWFSAETFTDDGNPRALFINQKALKLARLHVNRVVDNVVLVDFHFLKATPEGVTYTTEHHEYGLFSPAHYETAFAAAGLTLEYTPDYVENGVYVGKKN